MVGEVTRRHQLRGPSSAVLGSSALAYAADLIQTGAAQSNDLRWSRRSARPACVGLPADGPARRRSVAW